MSNTQTCNSGSHYEDTATMPTAEFSDGHTLHGAPICNWCGGMWVHDCH